MDVCGGDDGDDALFWWIELHYAEENIISTVFILWS